MKFDKETPEYEVNMETLREMEEVVPMTRREVRALRSWAKRGYDVETNPWGYTDSEGYPLNYMEAYRLEHGYSSGPWDYWRGPEYQLLWDNVNRRFASKDELW